MSLVQRSNWNRDLSIPVSRPLVALPRTLAPRPVSSSLISGDAALPSDEASLARPCSLPCHQLLPRVRLPPAASFFFELQVSGGPLELLPPAPFSSSPLGRPTSTQYHLRRSHFGPPSPTNSNSKGCCGSPFLHRRQQGSHLRLFPSFPVRTFPSTPSLRFRLCVERITNMCGFRFLLVRGC